MSYILDALRKSDQQRQRGSTPTLLTVQTTPTSPRRPKYLLNGVIAAALISAGILVGWLQPWQNKQVEPVASTPAASGSNRDVPLPTYGSAELSDGPQHESSTQPSTTAVEAWNQATNVTLAPQDPARADDSSTAQQPARGTQSAATGQLPVKSGATATSNDEGGKIMALNDLPPAIRREIPSIAIMFHAYSSDPGERRVMINGNMAKEGETLDEGLGLQQITPDGVIFLYRGYRFRHEVR
jgi:general secretion pathway protein B